MFLLFKKKMYRYRESYNKHKGSKQYCALCFECLGLKGNFLRNEVLGDACCIVCRKKLNRSPKITEFSGMNVYSEYIYQKEIRLAILQYKESKDKYLARIFLHPYWSYLFRKHVVVLVPSTSESEKRRGFNHVELLALQSGFKNIKHIFEHTGQQQQALKKHRDRKQVKQEIRLIDYSEIKNKKVLILDDIITSGSTILACEELIREHASSVDVLTIAHSPKLAGISKQVNLPFS